MKPIHRWLRADEMSIGDKKTPDDRKRQYSNGGYRRAESVRNDAALSGAIKHRELGWECLPSRDVNDE